MDVKVTEKHKFYVLIIMVLVAGVIGYFRFFRPPAAVGKQTAVSESTASLENASAPAPGPMQVQGRDPSRQRTLSRQISRNIFEPAGPLPAEVLPQPAAEAQSEVVDITLSGTIIGNHASIAIINNQFLRRGHRVGKYEIMRITPDRVYLACGDEQRILDVITVSQAITE